LGQHVDEDDLSESRYSIGACFRWRQPDFGKIHDFETHFMNSKKNNSDAEVPELLGMSKESLGIKPEAQS
jgi:hypothetical protein